MGQPLEAIMPVLPGWIGDSDLLLLLERLPQSQHQVLLLRYLLDLDTAEIADALDTTPANVRQLQSRALTFCASA